MSCKGTANDLDFRAFLRRLSYQPKFGVVPERLNRQESLATDHKLAEIIWCRQCEALLLSHDCCPGNCRNDARNAVSAQ